MLIINNEVLDGMSANHSEVEELYSLWKLPIEERNFEEGWFPALCGSEKWHETGLL